MWGDIVKKKIIITAVIILSLAGAFFFAEKPPEKVTENSFIENSVNEVSEIVSEISIEKSIVSEISEISVEESTVSEISEISVEESLVSEISEISVEESNVSEVSEISVEESLVSEVSEISVEESKVSEVSEISVEESLVSEISEISVEESSFIGNKTVCTVSISCSTLLNNLDRVKKNKLSVIPSDGWILTGINAQFSEGESVFDVTKRVCMENKIPFEFTLAPIYNTAYIEGINNIYEFDCGSTSGWLYKVNGEFKSYGCSDCKLNNGDIIEWVYTCDLGKDVGNEYKE